MEEELRRIEDDLPELVPFGADQVYVDTYNDVINKVLKSGLTGLPARFVLCDGPIKEPTLSTAFMYNIPALGGPMFSIFEFHKCVAFEVQMLCDKFPGGPVRYCMETKQYPKEYPDRSMLVVDVKRFDEGEK